ncbi:hypothetical protein MLD38_027364 [Melastoma candidum]|uniref:Uncharacterized protein n=1 Tax=Melastoma candidum TaxID=119954 RepID=A0ACB9P648_9MYRT|nr:hypothetical protein MLD38_027364 [Melastoma candidum]
MMTGELTRGIGQSKEKLQEVTVGLAAQAFEVPHSAGIGDHLPEAQVPSIRRFADDEIQGEENVQVFWFLKLEEDLENVLETTSELERLHIFSGSIGLSTHSVTIHSLAESCAGTSAEQPIMRSITKSYYKFD